MIANRGFGRWKGVSSFRDCISYITRGGSGVEPLAVWSEGVASITTAPLEMEAVAAQSKATAPLYHLIISWGPDERPTLEGARAALEEVRGRLGFEGLQHVVALQEDGVSGMWHAHDVSNLVDPVTYRARSVWRDRVVMREACRDVESEEGWRVVGEETSLVESETRDVVKGGVTAGSFGGSEWGSNSEDQYGVRTRFKEWVKAEVGPGLRAVANEVGASWERVRGFLGGFGLQYEVLGEARARITGAVSGWAIALKELGLSHLGLRNRLGEWDGAVADSRGEEFSERVKAARLAVAELPEGSGWSNVHAAVSGSGLGLERSLNGVRVVDLDSISWQRVNAKDGVLSLRSLEGRFGAYERSEVIEHREGASAALKAATEAAAAAALAKDPSPIYTTLFHTRSTVTMEKVVGEVARRVSGEEERGKVLGAVLGGMVEVDVNGERLATLPAVSAEERMTRLAAQRLSNSGMSRAVKPQVAAGLSVSERTAYLYAIDGKAALKVIAGLKSRSRAHFIETVAKAYRASGYRPRCVVVGKAGAAALRRKTSVPVRTVGSELKRWSAGEKIGGRDVLLIDDASRIGTAEGRVLLEAAAAAGAIVVAMSGERRDRPFGRGDALRIMELAVGERRVDVTLPVRGGEESRDDVRRRFEEYTARGDIHELGSQEEAREALLRRWSALEAGTQVGISTFSNPERRVLNELARGRFREMGRLSGDDVILETIDGRTPYAIGDRVVMRESVSGGALQNGSMCKVVGIRDGVLDLEREGVVVKVDTHTHPGVQHAYCTMEACERSLLEGGELQMATSTVAEGIVGGVNESDSVNYGLFYSREEMRGGMSALVELGTRVQRCPLVMDGIERGPLKAAIEGRGAEIARPPIEQTRGL